MVENFSLLQLLTELVIQGKSSHTEAVIHGKHFHGSLVCFNFVL